MDKNKIIEAAAKLVAKGAYDKAIKEYQKVLEFDAKDIRVLQKMGELFQKKNDNAQAAHYFTKVAESYSSDGFFLKAVALYKQVLKLNPNLIEVNLKLAELHQQLGLMSEAMAYFQIVANHHDKAGDTKSSLDTLKKMVDLDPDNVASRIKLAELYAREQMNAPALEEFRRAADYLKKNNRADDYLRVAERLAALEPENIVLNKELAQSYLQKGDQKRALARLQVCFKADPRDVETLNMLAQAFLGLGQSSKTLSVYKELAKIHAEKGQSSQANEVWKKIGEIDPSDPDFVARKGGTAAAASAPAPMPAAAPAPSRPAPARPVDSQAVTAPQSMGAVQQAPAASAAGGGGPAKDQLAKLLTETDVYVKYGLHDKALEHLRKIFAADPENLDAHEKAYHIYVSANNAHQAFEQLLNVLRLCTRRGEVQRGQFYLTQILQQQPNHPEVPAFLSVLRTDAVPEAVHAGADSVSDDAILVDSNDEEIIVAEEPDDALAGAGDDLALETATGADAEEVVEDDALVVDNTAEHDRAAYDLQADEPLTDITRPGLDEPLQLATGEDEGEVIVEDDALAAADAEEYDEPTTVGGALPFDVAGGDEVPAGELLADAGFEDASELAVEDDVPSEVVANDGTDFGADFGGDFDSQSLADAPPVATERQLPAMRPPPETTVRASNPVMAVTRAAPPKPAPIQPPVPVAAKPAAPAKPAPAPAPVAKAVPAAPPAGNKPPPKPAPPPEPEPVEEEASAAEELDEAGFFLDQGLAEEAREILETVLIAYPGHARAQELMERLEEMEQAGVTSAPLEPVDTEEAVPHVQPVSAEETTDSGSGRDAFDLAAELADELGETADASGAASALPGADEFQYSVEEVFSEFKKGLEKVVKPEDVDTHYDLGIAYKEMGLVDDAIGEFAQARAGCIGKKKEVDCLTMMGVLQVSKGDAAAAVSTFREALGTEHATGEAFKNLQYELASALEATGELGKALYHFQEVAKVDGGYRDVQGIIARLSGQAQPEPDPIAPNGGPKGGNGAGGGSGGPKNGMPGKGGGTPPAGTTAAQPLAAAGGKTRKVGYV